MNFPFKLRWYSKIVKLFFDGWVGRWVLSLTSMRSFMAFTLQGYISFCKCTRATFCRAKKFLSSIKFCLPNEYLSRMSQKAERYFKDFKETWEGVQDEQWPLTSTDEKLVKEIKDLLLVNYRLTIRDLADNGDLVWIKPKTFQKQT